MSNFGIFDFLEKIPGYFHIVYWLIIIILVIIALLFYSKKEKLEIAIHEMGMELNETKNKFLKMKKEITLLREEISLHIRVNGKKE